LAEINSLYLDPCSAGHLTLRMVDQDFHMACHLSSFIHPALASLLSWRLYNNSLHHIT